MVGFPKPYSAFSIPSIRRLLSLLLFVQQGTFSLIIEAWHAPEGYYPTGELPYHVSGRSLGGGRVLPYFTVYLK